MVTITSGPGRVVAAGSHTTFGGHPLRIEWHDDDNPAVQVSVELQFVTDSEVNGPDLVTEIGGDLVRLRCVNFEGAYGRGTALPIGVAGGESDVILLHFRALRFGQSPDWTVHWTLYRASGGRSS